MLSVNKLYGLLQRTYECHLTQSVKVIAPEAEARSQLTQPLWIMLLTLQLLAWISYHAETIPSYREGSLPSLTLPGVTTSVPQVPKTICMMHKTGKTSRRATYKLDFE